ncbi:MAG TPA: DUF6325 family protein [Dermatophilaceae bacterium]|nr:DUF6325 family protein [Dermatophilaceae bacterium]
MTEAAADIDGMGPVDYLIVEFPAGRQNFTGEMVEELVRLTEASKIRVLDLLIITKDDDGSVEAMEIDDLEMLAAAIEPGTVAGVLVWESTWAAPFGSAARRAGGQLVATGRIPIQAIAASMEAELAAEAAAGGN